MKPGLFTLTLGLLLPILTCAQITFPVHQVNPATEPLADTSFEAVMHALAFREKPIKNWLDYLPESVTLLRLENSDRRDYPLVDCKGNHPVAYAVETAFFEHRPLILSPDMIWLMIAQGFAAHVTAQPEEMRGELVSHKGMKELVVYSPQQYTLGDTAYDWLSVFNTFRDTIARNTNPEVARIIAAEFSTTGPEERAAYSVALMDAMSAYFRYTYFPFCGIPQITLEGTPADWLELERRFRELRPFLPEWWAARLEPILREFSLAAGGAVNTAFWKNIYQFSNADVDCDEVAYLSGWIIDFFPYVIGNPNPWVADAKARTAFEKAWEKNSRKKSKKSTFDPWPYNLPLLTVNDLPMGLAQAEVKIIRPDFYRKFDFRAGFAGIRQDSATLSLRPEISWLVVDRTETCQFPPPLPKLVTPTDTFQNVGDPEALAYFSRGDSVQNWSRYSGKGFELFILANGPGGSGRYWEIAVGLGFAGDTLPIRGFWFETSTLGWNTLLQFDEMPIPWASDLDGDGDPELIVWNSFFAGEDPETAPHPSGLIAWVYNINLKGKFRLNTDMTRDFAARIAASYRLDAGGNQENERVRQRIAAYLEDFSTIHFPEQLLAKEQ